MPRYYFHLRCREGVNGLATDLEGDELQDVDGVRNHALETARDLMRKTWLEAIGDWSDCTFEVTDEAGRHVLTLPFEDAAPSLRLDKARRC